MKKYRLKKEAVPFFADKLATSIGDYDFWNNYNVEDKALEEIEDVYIDYGIKKTKYADLCGWSEDGWNFCFTVRFPSMKYHEHDLFCKGKMVRDLMNRLQYEANRFMEDFYNGETKQD